MEGRESREPALSEVEGSGRAGTPGAPRAGLKHRRQTADYAGRCILFALVSLGGGFRLFLRRVAPTFLEPRYDAEEQRCGTETALAGVLALVVPESRSGSETNATRRPRSPTRSIAMRPSCATPRLLRCTPGSAWAAISMNS